MVLQKSKVLVGLFVLGLVPLVGAARDPAPLGIDRPPGMLTKLALASLANAAPSVRTEASPCAAGMVRVQGEACDEVEQTCKKFLDPPPYQTLRCAEYAPSQCKGAKRKVDFCIDREEAHDAATELPTVEISFVDAKAQCQTRGLHLCKETEWVFACEGEAMLPYPYGLARDSAACNIDKRHLGDKDGKLRDLRAKVSEYPRCQSPFGAHHMTGNVDEWTEREGSVQRSVLHGGWWLPGRNRCRASTAEHGPEYSGRQVGYRCCGAIKS